MISTHYGSVSHRLSGPRSPVPKLRLVLSDMDNTKYNKYITESRNKGDHEFRNHELRGSPYFSKDVF